MKMRMLLKVFPLVLFVLVCSARLNAQAPAQATDGAQRFAEFGDFKLKNGGVIHDFRLGYRTLGKLNGEKSNAILWPSWLGGASEDLLQFIGPGKVVDSGKYFIVLVDAIGNGVSSSPSNSQSQPRMNFPEFTIGDMVEAQHRLAADVLQLKHLRAVMGVSMGGMQVFAWTLRYPDFMDLAVPMLGSPQSTSYDKLLWTAEIEAMESDPAWNRGNPTRPLTKGIAVALEIDSMNETSPAYRVAHTDGNGFEAFLGGIKKNAKVDGGTASNQIRQREAILGLDLPRELGITLAQAAKKVGSKMLIIVCTQDHMVNPAPAIEFAKAGGFPLVQLNSACGHQSLTCFSVGPTVAGFLENPSSVRSQTMQDQANP